MNEDYKNWNGDDFFVFVLIHAAFADSQLQEEEQSIIAGILPGHRYIELIEFHKQNKDFENLNIIMELKGKYCNTAELKQIYRMKIQSIFDADGDFNLMERNMQRVFELIL
jgi:hypothetical protein